MAQSSVTFDLIRRAARQEQFLDLASRNEAEARFRAHLNLEPLGVATLALGEALGRVLSADIVAEIDVPSFDRSNVDGFALRAADTRDARPDAPRRLELNPEVITPGVRPDIEIVAGSASVIATGGMIPRGADAVIMLEQTEFAGDANSAAGAEAAVDIHQPVISGAAISSAGSDMAAGETVLRKGAILGFREIAILAAIGRGDVPVYRRPRVAILSTGDELAAPGEAIRPGQVYDSNGPMLAAAASELGCEPVPFGIVDDDEALLAEAINRALATCDVVVMSGGTSKGAGDLGYRALGRFTDPGIVVHGVALKPGKPLCLAVTRGKPVAILPGFPTSAIFTFQEFVAPVLRRLAGLSAVRRENRTAKLAVKTLSELGRTEYVMASLTEAPDGGLVAYPGGKSSGSVTSFAQADAFFAVPAQVESLAAGTEISVRLIDGAGETADLVVIGSHCVGLDRLIGRMIAEGFRVKSLSVGSLGGIMAVRRGECDVAGIHLMDPQTGVYNAAYASPEIMLVNGYGRLQGMVFRKGDERFAGADLDGAIAAARADPDCIMANRNPGSGTRILIDQILADARPNGYSYQVRSHNAVAAAVAQGRADWGVAIETVARLYGLDFLPLRAEQYDFAIPAARLGRAPVRRFLTLLRDPNVRAELKALGFE
jgi:molybdopterin molybdotransferase/putative molybdopterin biosynthesis protein